MTLVLVSLMGCSKENEVDADPAGDGGSGVPGAIGSQCSGPDDPVCGTNGVCVLGWCRLGCLTDAECPQGALCIGDTPPFGCSLPQDYQCSTDQPCKEPLVCGLDKTCRMPCQVSKDCPRNEQECHAGVCVGDSEKGEAAIAYRSCGAMEGLTRCGTTGADCTSGDCDVQGCNMTAPGWGLVDACPSDKAFCVKGVCQWEDPRCETGTVRCAAVSGVAIPRDVESCNTLQPGWVAVAHCDGDTAFCEQGTCVGVKLEPPGPMVQVPTAGGGTYGIDATEVTRAQYAKFVLEKNGDMADQPPECEDNTYYNPDPFPPTDHPDYPVTSVDWCDAFAYCKWAGKRLCGKIDGGPLLLGDETDISKSQWFNACSSGGLYPEIADAEQVCNFNIDLRPVMSNSECESSEPGYEGVYDLIGNASEWIDLCWQVAGKPDRCYAVGGDAGTIASCTFLGASERDEVDHLMGFRCCSDP